jgi:hypothetical protein
MLLISLLLTIIAVILWKDTIHSRLFSAKISVLVFWHKLHGGAIHTIAQTSWLWAVIEYMS